MKLEFRLLFICFLLSISNISYAKKTIVEKLWDRGAKIAQVVLIKVLEDSVDQYFHKQQLKEISNLRSEVETIDRDSNKDLKKLLDNIEKLIEANRNSKKRISQLEKIVIQQNSMLIKKHLSFVDHYDQISISNSGWYKIKASPSLRVRSAPSLRGKKIGSIPNKGKIKVVDVATKLKTIDGHEGRWVLVAYKNITGYVFSGFLIPIGNSPDLSRPTYIGWFNVKVQPHLNIRSTPSVRGKIIGSLKNGSKVKVIKYMSTRMSIGGRYGRWVKVSTRKGSGYVFDAFLKRE